MEKFKKLLALCKCGVFLTVNEHRDYYYTAAQELDAAKSYPCQPNIDAEVEARMIETDTIVRLHFYPDTPIGSYEVWHYDIDSAIDEALSCLTKNSSGEAV
jgi:hypothetical protein